VVDALSQKIYRGAVLALAPRRRTAIRGFSAAAASEVDAMPGSRYATLATVSLDVVRGAMTVRAGGLCAHSGPWWTTSDSTRVVSMEGA
jgi:hypothetical protein